MDLVSSTASGPLGHISSTRMEELLSCSVCCEAYQEKLRHPVLLPRCGHSFCRPCVSFLVKNGCVICPSCRMDQRVETADHLPTEFSLLAITSAQQVTKMEMCGRHDVKLSFWCKSCNEPACGECLFEDHPTHSHAIIKSSTYITEMKDAVKDVAYKFEDALDLRERWYHEQVFSSTKLINDAIRTLSVLRRDIDDARELIKGVNVVEGIGPTTALSDASKCLGLKWNLKGCQLDLMNAGGKVEQPAGGERKVGGEDTSMEKTDGEEKVSGEEQVSGEEKNETVKEAPAEDPAEEKEKTDVEKKTDAAEEKEIDELENLTEEERRKRRKILRVKEKLAAAAASAAATDKAYSSKDKLELVRHKTENKKSTKEKSEKEIDTKEKDNDRESLKSLAAAKTKRLSRKYAPVSREPSCSPVRDSPPDAAPSRDGDIISKSELKPENEKGTQTDFNIESPDKTNKEYEEESNKLLESASLSEINAKKEAKSKLKSEASLGVTKKPRGRLARQALKRSQTMNFIGQTDDDKTDASKDDQSDDIKGLDLETTKLGKSDGLNNKEKEEALEEEPKEAKEDEKKDQENSEKNVSKVFEMEPEEKERIATELLQVPSLTLVVEGIGGRLAYVTWEPMGMHVYCHQYQELPYDLLIKSTVLLSLIPTKSPMVFLDVGTEERVLGRVYISLWGHLRRATNFLHLCLGDRGPSFRNTMFLEVLNADSPGERIKGGDYEYNNGRGGETLVDDLETQEGYSMPMEAGMVTAGGPNMKEIASHFFICTEDDFDRRFACPFGRVVSGLPVMKEAVWLVVTKEMWIVDCGVVIETPRI